jgi:hypothetical protein
VAASLCFAQIPYTAFAEPPTPEQIDAALDQLVQMDPATLAQRVEQMKTEASQQEAESASLKQKATELETRVAAINEQIASVSSTLKALFGKVFLPEIQAAQEVQMAAVSEMAAPAPDANIQMAGGAMPESQVEVIAYESHIRPIFENRCFRCHNNSKRRSGLSLQTFATVMEGGSSGPVIEPGNPDGSRLYRLISGAEEPAMPPSGGPLSPDEKKLIHTWLKQGAPANPDSEIMKQEEAPQEKTEIFIAAAILDGPPPMPEVALPMPEIGKERGLVARALATNPRSPLVAVAGYRQVLLYDLETGTWLGVLDFPEGAIQTLTFSVNGELLVAAGGQAGVSGRAVVWNVRTAERLGVYGEEYDTLLAADISPDHRLLALGGPDRVVRVYSTSSNQNLYELTEHTDWILAVKFTPDGEVLASADRAGGLNLWQAANGRFVETLKGHEGAINALAYTIDSTILASAGQDGTVRLWDTWKYSQIRQFGAHNASVSSVDFSPDNNLITTSADKTTKRWNLDGEQLSTYENLPDWGYQAAFSPQTGEILAGSWNGQIAVWNIEGGTREATLSTTPDLRETTAMAGP